MKRAVCFTIAVSIIMFVGTACHKEVQPSYQSTAKAGDQKAAATQVETARVESLPAPKAAGRCEGQRDKLAAEALTRGHKVFDGVKLTESTKQAEILSAPAMYDGKTVRIEGPVVGVCQAAGCWAALQGPEGKKLNLKVTDGVVDFRKIARVGQYVVGEGVFNGKGHHGAQVKITGAMIGPSTCD